MTSPLLSVLLKQPCNRVPVWFMRQAGRYLPEYRELRKHKGSFLDLCYSPQDAAEVTLQPLRRFDLDAAILFSDILVIPDALGCKVQFLENHGPQLSTIRDEASLNALSLENLHPHLAPVYETLSLLRSQLPQDKALIGFSGSPWTLACYMIEGKGSKDFAFTRSWAIAHPHLFHRLQNLLIEAISEYLIAQVKAGAQVLKLFDSWAGVVPSAYWNDWIIAPTRAIISRVRLIHPDIPIIGFPRQAGVQALDYATHTGITALACDQFQPLPWIANTLQPSITVQGNLDNLTLATDPVQAVQHTQHILHHLASRPFIFNLGHGIIPETPIAHVEKVIETIRAFPLSHARHDAA